MLVFKRSLGTSRVIYQAAVQSNLSASSEVAQAKGQLDEYLKYWQTPKDTRYLIYREKHAHDLLSRDIKDPATGLQITPRQVPHLPSQEAILILLADTKTPQDLIEFRNFLTKLVQKTTYVTPRTICDFLVRSAELGQFPTSLQYLYSMRKLYPIRFHTVLNTISLFYYLHPSKSIWSRLEHINTARGFTKSKYKDSILSNLAVVGKYKREGKLSEKDFEKIISKISIDRIKDQNAILFPQFPDEIKADGQQQLEVTKQQKLNFYESKKFFYLGLKPISVEYAQFEQLKDLDKIKDILKFIGKYEAYGKELGLDYYQDCIDGFVFKSYAQIKSEEESTQENEKQETKE